MTEAARKKAVYEDLLQTPENMMGEIINGEVSVSRRPSRKHIHAGAMPGGEIGPPYVSGRSGGPGGRVVPDRPEISFGGDIPASDPAGWKKERFPADEPQNWISATPDRVCGILSPTTAPVERAQKMVIHARPRMSRAWLIDSVLRTPEVFQWEAGRWDRHSVCMPRRPEYAPSPFRKSSRIQPCCGSSELYGGIEWDEY